MDPALNVALYTFHTALIVFNLFGWLWNKTRKAQLVTLGLTIAGWLIVGAFKGVGYCVITDIHWRVRARMGITDDPDSFVALLIRDVTGVLPSAGFVAGLCAVLTAIALIGSVTMLVRDRRGRTNRTKN